MAAFTWSKPQKAGGGGGRDGEREGWKEMGMKVEDERVGRRMESYKVATTLGNGPSLLDNGFPPPK